MRKFTDIDVSKYESSLTDRYKEYGLVGIELEEKVKEELLKLSNFFIGLEERATERENFIEEVLKVSPLFEGTEKREENVNAIAKENLREQLWLELESLGIV